MKRVIVLSSVVALVLVLAIAAIAWADDAVPGYGYGEGYGYGDCPIGEFVDEDGDGVCDNAPRAGIFGPNERRGIIQEGRSSFSRFGDGPGPSDGDGVCDNFVDEDGDGVCDNAPRDGTYGPNERRGMVQEGRSFFSRFGDGSMNGEGRMVHRGLGHRNSVQRGEGHNFVDADGNGVCDNFIDEDGDGICDIAPRDGTGKHIGHRGHRSRTQK